MIFRNIAPAIVAAMRPRGKGAGLSLKRMCARQGFGHNDVAMTGVATQSARRRAYAACVLTAVTVAVCAVLMTAVTLAPAPLAVLPLAVAICIGCPMVTAW